MVAELREALDSREPVSNVIVTQEGDFQESLTATKEPPVLIQEGGSGGGGVEHCEGTSRLQDRYIRKRERE